MGNSVHVWYSLCDQDTILDKVFSQLEVLCLQALVSVYDSSYPNVPIGHKESRQLL